MKNLPKSEIYEKEFEFMPWGTLINEILDIIEKEVPQNGKVLDLMCGPGYLLGEISKRREDLILEGTDINKEFIQFAQDKYKKISFQIGDVLLWKSTQKYDLILCTGGLHHIPYDKQALFLEKIPSLLNSKGFAIFADPYIDDYSNDSERKQSAAKLGYEYMIATMKNGASEEIIKATIDILHNDVMGFEYKSSLEKMEPIFRKYFSKVEVHKTWPKNKSKYGDYYFLLNIS